MDATAFRSQTIAMASPIVVKFGITLKRARESRGLSQEAMAECAGISRSFLSEVERGESAPTLETMQKLAIALGERLSYLINECENSGDAT